MNFAYWQSVAAGGVVASGGTATSGNSYNQWSFTATGSNTFTVTTGGTVYYAIVAGGGGGGCWDAGGGGSGGVITGQTVLTAGTYTVIVGTGGSGGVSSSPSNGVPATNGGNSSAFGFTSVGGAAGSSYNSGYASYSLPINGGSGGGGMYNSPSQSYIGGVGVAGQGWSGGSASSGYPYASGGGGGAGGVGSNASSGVAGNGGTGLGVYLPVSNTTVYYGGGGGGGYQVSGSAGSGGTGGGGAGATLSSNATAGSANTGGGGGGGAGTNSYASGGNGGSGIVVIWSPIATPAKTPYVQYLAVAGGGGGGQGDGGGGGAGGVLQGITQVASGTSYTITVGNGGNGSTAAPTSPTNGGNSVFGSFATAIGGGAAGTSGASHNGQSGGSGGGGDNSGNGATTGGAGTTGQGYAGGGGSGYYVNYFNAGGGGGYGMIGATVLPSSAAGNGGDGFTTYIANPATYSWSAKVANTYFQIGSPTSTLLNWYSGSYTIEYWIFPTSFNSYSTPGMSNVVGNMQPTSGNYWSFGPIVGGSICFYYYNGNENYINTSSTIPLNTWTHLAFVNNAGSLTIYINGVSSATATISSTPLISTSAPLTVGTTYNLNSNFYISNLRVTNTAVYTSAFTPSTTPLTAISGTQLLTANAPTFTDSSSNAFSITNINSYIASQNPFGASYAGGGGGGVYTVGAGYQGYGGMGGGGMGGYGGNMSGVNGASNTGAGGGGTSGNSLNGAAGGSGIVILAYPSTFPDASSVTNGTKTTVGGFKIYTFLTSGSITF
jgi:hypothetical protein